ncbi:hypothetical protein Ais01nite_47840 [Asanoa ishikariensis]|uniref:Uncharacterized protein n=1 Tax=Asanoa ishikariensis TaxID=137265 RepID=A0A1H3RXM5_9ACTN|nr:hypothetical protein [Asanoa ishikariensis]GIF66749.1 hypothetical protein Ais01nite_47840 [Asanoa ishikariensis]SDZ30011.1 hypothetical protein SAMN05421684_4301 [Asanoa ishikariensis]
MGYLATLAAVTLCYILVCWVKPFGRCARCRGVGAHPHLITRRLRPCRRCHASGLRLRTGRRIFNYFAAIQRDAARKRVA